MNTTPLCPKCGKPLEAGAPKGLCPACLMAGAFATGTEPDGKSPRFVPPTVAELAPKFPQLEVLEFIGQGGMGAVYKARQKELDRVVALKILPPDIGPDAAFAERFTREARALAKLNHPGIVTIHDFGRADGLFFFVMEFVDGVNLRQLLHTSRIEPREALAIVPQICDALQFAHDQGIVHRDIKPENILLDRRGRVKVADFGLVKLVGAEGGASVPASRLVSSLAPPNEAGAALTDAGKVMGTPQYMSPEQFEAPGEVDHRADIYALGVVFYQMLTGELPGKRIEAPSKKVSIDVRLDEVVLRALEKKPELRYQQASILKTQVETIAETPSSNPKSSQPKMSSLIPEQYKKPLAGLLFGVSCFVIVRTIPNLAVALGAIGVGISNWPSIIMLGIWLGIWVVISQLGWRLLKSWLLVLGLGEGVMLSNNEADRLLRLAATSLYRVLSVTVGIKFIASAGVLTGGMFTFWSSGWIGKIICCCLIAGLVSALVWTFKSLLKPGDGRESATSEPPSPAIPIPMPPIVSRKLKIIAAIFIFTGVWSLMDTLFDNGVGNLTIMPSALLLPLGFGLLNRREFCCRAAVWCIVAGFVFNLIMLGWLFGKAFGLFAGLDVVARILGQPLNSAAGATLTFLVFAGQFILLPWMFLVLIRDDVRSAFAHAQNKPRPFVEWGMTAIVLLIMSSYVRIPLENRLKTGVYFTNLKPAVAVQTNAPSFGPAVERVVVAFDENPAQACLDVGRGEFHAPPPVVGHQIRELANQEDGETFTGHNPTNAQRDAWLNSSGVDLIGGLDAEGHPTIKYIGQPPHFQTGWSSFASPDPNDVLQMLQASPFYSGDKPNFPAGYVNVINPRLQSVQNAEFILFRTHDGDVGVLQVLGTNQNPRGVKIRYKLVQNSVTTTAPVRLPAVAKQDSFGPVVERVASNPPFSATFPGGSVELVGLSEFLRCANPALGVTHEQVASTTNKIWWRPDGSPLNRSIRGLSSSLNAPGRDIYELAVKVEALGSDLPDVIMESLPDARCYPAGVSGGEWAKRPEDKLFKLTLSCDSGLKLANFRVGVAAGPWQTVHKFGFSSGASAGGESGSMLSSVVIAGDETVVTCSYERPLGSQIRLVALGPKGEIFPVRQGPSQGVGQNYSVTLVFKSADIQGATLNLQHRRYQWVEFYDVTLEPGARTKVKVRDAGGKNPVVVQPSSSNQKVDLTFGPVVERSVEIVSGQFGKAYRFDGVGSHVTFPASDALNVGVGDGMTCATWIKPETLGMQVIGEWNNGTGEEGAHLWISVDAREKGDGVGNLYAELYDIHHVRHTALTRSGIIEVGKWQHVAVTYDKTSGMVRLFRNGSVAWEGYLGTFTPQTSYDFHLGYRASGRFSGTHFKGLMEQPAIYDRALTADEIESIYRNEASKPEPSVNLDPSKVEPPAPNLSFGPVMERVVNLQSPGTNSALDLDSGRFVPLDPISFPEGATNRETPAHDEDYIRDNGMDVHGMLEFFESLPSGSIKPKVVPLNGLACVFGTYAQEIEASIWDTAAADWVAGNAERITHLFEHGSLSGVGNLPRTYLFKTREGGKGLLQITGFTENPRAVKIRYKLVPNSTHQSSAPKSISTAGLNESPKLRFLAWQDEWKTNKPFGAWHPDGSPVTNEAELVWLREVHPGGMDVSSYKLNPEPRFLHLWFSHPQFSQAQWTDIVLLDQAGQPVKLGGQSSMACGSQEASERNGSLGWKTWSLSPSETTNIPAQVTVQLRYTVGPLERTQELKVVPNSSTSMSLEGGSQLNGVGQNVDGRAFIGIAVDAKKMVARQFDVVAVARDGRELSAAGVERSGTVGAGVRVESFDFKIPLEGVAKFIIGSRPVRTNEWKDVVLPPK